MAKQKKRTAHVEDGRDKPDFAADWFGKQGQKVAGKTPSGKQDTKKNADDAQPTVEQFLGNDMTARLRQMKAALEEEASREAQKSAGGEKSSSRSATHKGPSGNGFADRNSGGRGSATRRHDGDETQRDIREDASFAELFDPAPADDDSFEDMLGKSKLDWRSFKD
ncbi:hypothetical protein JZ785_11670 [Alicyclobacillus curvatus]|nr:hypothetical protein JZ785_11670 [Alicyclobacillus curvatus]